MDSAIYIFATNMFHECSCSLIPFCALNIIVYMIFLRFIQSFMFSFTVLTLIQRRHYAQVKTAVPVIINVLKAMRSKSDDEDINCEELFHKAIGIAYSIRAICVKLVRDKY